MNWSNAISISDWGLEQRTLPLVDADESAQPIEITEKAIAEMYRDNVTGDVDWDSVRDTLHEEKYADDPEYSTKQKAAAARTVMRTFTMDMQEGDVILVNTPEGTAFASVNSPAYYQTGTPHQQKDDNHVMYRNVKFLRDEDGNIVTVPVGNLPEILKPNPKTVSKVNRDGMGALLDHATALEALAAVAPDN